MMNKPVAARVSTTRYDRSSCDIGVVHLGYGAFHRAHQAVYIDNYMEHSGDFAWGIAAVNLRASEAPSFGEHDPADGGYVLKSVAPTGEAELSRVRSHIAFADWSEEREGAEDLAALQSVKMMTITVTESGYYTDASGALDLKNSTIAAEIARTARVSVYAYLAGALERRKAAGGAPITVCCCDNIYQNGKMLARNFTAYLTASGRDDLKAWVQANVTFPCSLVDRITPRPTHGLAHELSAVTAMPTTNPVLAEAFSQWVLEDNFAGNMPDLATVGVIVTPDVNAYEVTKLRILNGGHTCLAYLAALHGIETFDQAMRKPELFNHFWSFETGEVLPALSLELPFSKSEYLDKVSARFKNASIADTTARICADGFAKFPIFIRPTIEGCFRQGITAHYSLVSIASWYVFARRVQAGLIDFDYLEPSWALLEPMLGTDNFLHSEQLWGDLPTQYPEFVDALRSAIQTMELTWPM